MTPIATLQQKFESDVGRFKTFVQTTQGLWLGKPAEREINVVIGSVNGKVTEVREKFARASLGGPATASPELDTIGVAFTSFMQASIERIRSLATANATNAGEVTQTTTGAGIRVGTQSTSTATAETRVVDTVADTTGATLVVAGGETSGGDEGSDEGSGARISPAPGGFNPLWLILAGVAIGVVALSASRQRSTP